jgi:hypothetical protein
VNWLNSQNGDRFRHQTCTTTCIAFALDAFPIVSATVSSTTISLLLSLLTLDLQGILMATDRIPAAREQLWVTSDEARDPTLNE